jgi:hypothetical protein
MGMLLCGSAWAVEIEGVSVPDRVTVGGQEIGLNGAGIRTKVFFDIYVGALYLAEKTGDAKAAIEMAGPKRVFMHYLYSEISREKLVGGWEAGFKKNQSKKTLESLRSRLDKFNAMFADARKGDVILLDYVPEKGTSVTINGETKGVVPGEDFNRALLAIWLGKKPADSGLKKAMLKPKR